MFNTNHGVKLFHHKCITTFCTLVPFLFFSPQPLRLPSSATVHSTSLTLKSLIVIIDVLLDQLPCTHSWSIYSYKSVAAW